MNAETATPTHPDNARLVDASARWATPSWSEALVCFLVGVLLAVILPL